MTNNEKHRLDTQLKSLTFLDNALSCRPDASISVDTKLNTTINHPATIDLSRRLFLIVILV